MLSLAVAVAISSSIMRAVSTLNESRFEPKYFTRNLKMPFERLLKFLLSMYKTSSQAALNKFFESKGITTDSPMRMHLLNHLSGNIAWRHPEDAIAQRERLKQKRIAEREQRNEPVSEVREQRGNVPDESVQATASNPDDSLYEDEEISMDMAM